MGRGPGPWFPEAAAPFRITGGPGRNEAVLDSLGCDGLVAPGLEKEQEGKMLAWQHKLSRRIAGLASLAALESPLILDS